MNPMVILLVHGLGRTPVSLFGLAAALRKAGHCTTFFGYSPTLEPLPHIVRRLAAKVAALGRRGVPLGVVGHSLGGLLLRMALPRVPAAVVRHAVLLGTPNHPPRLARWAWRLPPFRLASRDCGRLLATPALYEGVPPLDVPHTVVAGTAGPCGRWSPFGADANDGVVSVCEARCRPGDEPVRVPAWHSFLMDDARVRRVVVAAMA